MDREVIIALNKLSKKINEICMRIDNTAVSNHLSNKKDIETSAGGIDDLAEFADTNAGAVDDLAVALDEVLTAIDELATYAASIDERLTALEKRGE